jgi:hypothetical protein
MIEFRDMPAKVSAIDADVRAASPKCPECNRPDGGVVPNDRSAWDAGLVDRKRCPSPTCPMRPETHTSLVVNHGVPRS